MIPWYITGAACLIVAFVLICAALPREQEHNLTPHARKRRAELERHALRLRALRRKS